jgi:glycosyltransferase domain-containing protein
LTSSLSDKFTLIVPTYNRPTELSRLLAYLVRHGAGFPVLVLDSSTPTVQEINRATVASAGGNINLHSFDTQISPWEKFLRGSELAETECCSLCADDDLVLPDSLGPLVNFILEHSDYSLAQGWYFTFYDNVHIGITASVYRSASIDQDSALDRVFTLFQKYEAVTYGVYRTSVLRTVLHGVQGVESMLAKELLGGALSVVHGKAARLPVFYYARSHSPSHPYHHWHPLDFLVSSPEALYRDYAAYRKILLQCFKTSGNPEYSEEELATLIDLAHFRYLSDYVKPRVMDYLIEQVRARTPKAEIMQGVWSALARDNDSALVGALSGSQLVRRIRDRFFPRIRLHHLKRLMAPGKQKMLHSITASGKPRDYLFYAEFLASLSRHATPDDEMREIVGALDRYE